ncbi:MAG: hypothetical protein ACYS8Z_14115 [Planctomycetota bacterium]
MKPDKAVAILQNTLENETRWRTAEDSGQSGAKRSRFTDRKKNNVGV